MPNKNKYIYIIVFLSLILFIPFLGYVHLFDWDEINFAESAREMIVSKSYSQVMINFEAFHEKPPLFIWMQVISMKIFGVNEFAARFPNAIVGLISLLFIFTIGKKIKDEKFAFIWVISYIGSLLPFFYFKSGIIDPTFNLFIFSSIFYFYEFIQSNKRQSFIISIILISLAILTKGPVGLLMFLISTTIFVLINKNYKRILNIFVLSVISIIPYLFWYYIAFGDSPELLEKFLHYHIKLLTTGDSGHSGPFYYHFLVVLFAAFPASFFAIPTIKNFKKYDKHSFLILNIILLFAVLIVFGIVKTKILHYSSLAYFPLTFIAANYVYTLIKSNNRINKVLNVLVIIYAFILAIAFIAFPLVLSNIDQFIHFVKDKFTKEILQAEITWTGFEILPGLILLLGLILYIYLQKKNTYRAILTLFLFVSLTIFTFMFFLAPKIEGYTQNAVVEFCEAHSQENAIIQPLGFKSYSNYFYGKVKMETKLKNVPNSEQSKYLLENEVDFSVYFIVKKNKLKKYEEYNFNIIYEKNGFVFLKK